MGSLGLRPMFVGLLLAQLLSVVLGDIPPPRQPTLLFRSDTAIGLSWGLPNGPGGESAVFNLLLGPKSMFTGKATSFTVRGLAPDTCYPFKLKAFYEGKGWSRESEPLMLSTLPSTYGGINMLQLESELGLKRRKIRDSALAEYSSDPCPIAGLGHPEYSHGNVHGVSFKGSVDRVSPIGREVSLVNCDLAKCAARLDKTAPYSGTAGTKQGRIEVAIGMDWQLGLLPQFETKFVAMSDDQPTLTWTEPRTGKKNILPLVGCRAAPVVTADDIDINMNAMLPSLAEQGAELKKQAKRAAPDIPSSPLPPLPDAAPTAAAAAAASAASPSQPKPAAPPQQEQEQTPSLLLLEAAADAHSSSGSGASSGKTAGRRASALSRSFPSLKRKRSLRAPAAPSPAAAVQLVIKTRRTGRGLPLLHPGCFELNCTATTGLQYLFCEPTSTSSAQQEEEQEQQQQQAQQPTSLSLNRDVRLGRHSKPLRAAVEWSDALNYASLGLRRPYRYEVLATVGVARQPVDDNRRPREKGYLESAVWREAWVMSFLAALPLAGATPHFPILYDAYACSKLPDKFASPAFPTEGTSTGSITGALPLALPGAAVTTIGAGITNRGGGGGGGDSGGGTYYSWAVSYSEAIQSDLQAVLDSYPNAQEGLGQGAALSGGWFRGVLFQLVYSLAVGRHAFGLHHNGMLSLSNVKVVQMPRGSPGYRQYDCYRTTPDVINGAPLLVPIGKNAAPAPSPSPSPLPHSNSSVVSVEDSGGDGWDDENAAGRTSSTHAGPASTLVSGRSTRGDPDSLFILDANRPDLDACVRERKEKALRLARRDQAGQQLVDALQAANAAAAAGLATDPKALTSPLPPPGTPHVSASTDSSAPEDRTAWCVPSADVYGLRVKIQGGLGSSSLVRKQLEWWSQLGYAFPNTAWRDDLRDLSISFCGPAAEKVEGFHTYASGMAADLCSRMLQGEYADNPAAALRHPLFSGLATATATSTSTADARKYFGLIDPDSVQSWQRSLYTYAPLTVGRKLRKPGDKPGSGKGDGSGHAAGGDLDSSSGSGAHASPSPFALYPDDAPVPRYALLSFLEPKQPWIAKKDRLSATIAWEAHDRGNLPAWAAQLLPSPPTTFNLFVDGRSVYSGPSKKHAISLLRRDPQSSTGCVLRVQVSAFYPSLGWTAKSRPLEVQARDEGC